MIPSAFALLRRGLTNRLLRALLTQWDGLGAWHRNDAQRFSAAAVPLVLGAQTALAGLVTSYVANTAAVALKAPVAPPAIPAEAHGSRLRLLDPQEVYQRPFVATWTQLAAKQPLADAVASGRARLREVAEADMQQAYAESAQAAMEGLPEAQQPTGWRRVLTGRTSCALCVVASTQLYHRIERNRVHPGCDCTVEPFYGPRTQVIDPQRLEQVHTAVAMLTGQAPDRGARAIDYRHLLTTMTRVHGELGPLLVRPQDRFTDVRKLGLRPLTEPVGGIG